MGWQAWTLAGLIVVFAALQYTLAWSAIVDLLHRPRVRGNSHIFWALTILCVPIIGALAYGAVGPTSFRSNQILNAQPDYEAGMSASAVASTPANIMPFRKNIGRLSDNLPAQRPGLTRSRAHGSEGAVSRLRRPGA